VTSEELRDLLRRDVVAAAPALLGAILVRGELRARIVETEAYRADDPACHAYRKTTMRNMVLFGEPGRAYVYLNYGMHWMLNVSAHESGEAAGILIRAAEPLEGLEQMRANRGGVPDQELLSGPGKLAKAFGITRDENDLDLLSVESHLRILPSPSPVGRVLAGPRIGIAEGKGHEIPWRFMDAERLAWVSKPRPRL
jgi:DNA-3-methyladenine glycosylase